MGMIIETMGMRYNECLDYDSFAASASKLLLWLDNEMQMMMIILSGIEAGAEKKILTRLFIITGGANMSSSQSLSIPLTP